MEGSLPLPLRLGLLDGRGVAVAGAGATASAVAEVCTRLGARVDVWDPAELDLLDEDAVGARVEEAAGTRGLHAVVVDAGERFAAGGMRAAADAAWVVARAAGARAMIEDPDGGKLVLIAPAPGAGEHAHATRAALENLARTLSIEWARHDIRPTTIAPGRDTAAHDVAVLAAYVASPAGDYFSGCVFSLGGAGG
jgi:citronellol/citronellal dehydrogenase